MTQGRSSLLPAYDGQGICGGVAPSDLHDLTSHNNTVAVNGGAGGGKLSQVAFLQRQCDTGRSDSNGQKSQNNMVLGPGKLRIGWSLPAAAAERVRPAEAPTARLAALTVPIACRNRLRFMASPRSLVGAPGAAVAAQPGTGREEIQAWGQHSIGRRGDGQIAYCRKNGSASVSPGSVVRSLVGAVGKQGINCAPPVPERNTALEQAGLVSQGK